MNAVFDAVFQAVKGDDLKQVYPSFDAVPVVKKSSQLFTVVGFEQFQTEPIIPDGGNGVIPFTAVFRISVLGDFQSPLRKSEDFLFQVLLPRVSSIGGVVCEILPATTDMKLQKTVVSALVRVNGFYSEGVTE